MNSLPGGRYQVTARYGGDNIFGTSGSTPVAVDVTPEATLFASTAATPIYDCEW